jgi:hypothetical protein
VGHFDYVADLELAAHNKPHLVDAFGRRHTLQVVVLLFLGGPPSASQAIGGVSPTVPLWRFRFVA